MSAPPRVHFLEEQRRHRRTSAASSAVVVVVLAVSGIPLSVLLASRWICVNSFEC